ncbi:Zinc ribbon domain-containing protein [Desulfonema limicola]|uniref:Zinc ribbon domain-containing protein n=1 Tax=Desulfonema limicola TaxID=45656 RepID=A0A975BEK1_9BACT|nr:zinc ribbon domain-containing protein [Desulfonema limicola]QTA83709.1 Zinc ribbon domain-containing protein [Desulfonema limicola]
MPIYEFYCKDCHTVFNFFSKTIDTDTCPLCPKCKENILTRQVSLFAFTGRAKEKGDMEEMPFDESKMEQAIQVLAKESEKMKDDDPVQAARLMRRLSDMTGVKMGQGMEEALARLEKGEDPDQIESEMGDILEGEDPFLIPDKKSRDFRQKIQAPLKDETLYELNPE